jgi:hypothetical protein
LTAVFESSSLDLLVTPSKRPVMLPLARCIACDAVLGRCVGMGWAGEEGGEVGTGGGGMSSEDLIAVFPCICIACLDDPGRDKGYDRPASESLASFRSAALATRANR